MRFCPFTSCSRCTLTLGARTRRLHRPLPAGPCHNSAARISNAHLDAYVLSESSLFVYRHRVVIKTCGTTTLLRCIAYLLQHAGRGLGMELEWVGYSRKNFTAPGAQLYPHGSFEQELQYLRVSGSALAISRWRYILSPLIIWMQLV
jgi:Adenosylmethionine decarboxylase